MLKIGDLRPGDTFRFKGIGEREDVPLRMCLWQVASRQMATPDDTRTLINFGFINLGTEHIEHREWHDCNAVELLVGA